MIDRDLRRFREIVRGKVRENLKKYMTQGEMIGRQGGRPVSIPVPNIEIPRFRFGRREQDGVGQGAGDKGEPIAFDPNQPGGDDQAGNVPGHHIMEVEVSLRELAKILGEELELPDIEPRGKENIESIVERYTDIRRVGPESLRHFRRTYREALKRSIAEGTYDFNKPCVVPVREDKRYRCWESRYEPDSNAVIIYMMDASGSMSERKKKLVRMAAFWIDTWLRYQYQKLDVRYLMHDTRAWEVDQDTFYTVHEAGGTYISSAYEYCLKLILEEYHPAEWNVYPFHFTDGDNWSDDNEQAFELLSELLGLVNMFCYGEVNWMVRMTRFSTGVEELAKEHDKLTVSKMTSEDGVYEVIKDFLGKGK